MVDIAQIKGVLDLTSRVRELGASLLSLIKRLRRQPEDPAPGDWSTRSSAYIRLQSAALAASLNLQLLAAIGTPPKLVGAIWTWPSAARASRRVSESFNELLSALFEIALVGDHAVLDAAVAAGEALGHMASSFPVRRGGGDLPPEFACLVEAANARLLDFVAAARTDLRKKE